jgi:Co/Zn/Cd efflux system component
MEKCCAPVRIESNNFKKAVLIALILNFSMFIFEVISSYLASSSSLKADSLDFLGDSANYVISLYVLSKTAQIRSKASLIKGLTMVLFSAWVFSDIFINLTNNNFPKSEIMGWTGLLAFAVNISVAFLLYKHRDGDSNMKSVWICSRNDAIGNLAVIIAAFSVAYFQNNKPDILVAFLMAGLSGYSGVNIIKLASSELKNTNQAAPSKKDSCCG